MLNKKTASMMAVLCMLALSSPALAGEWWSTQCFKPYMATDTTQAPQEGQANQYRDYRWTGQTTYCPGEAAGPCQHTYGESHAVSVTHTINVGISLEGNNEKALATLKAEFGYSYARTTTDTKTWSFTVPIPQGRYARPVAYVLRAWSWGHFRGAHKYLHANLPICEACPVSRGCEYRYDWRWEDFGHWEGHQAKSDVIVSFDIW